MPASTLVVVNPRSRSGAGRRRFRALEPRLREALGPLEVAWTRGPRDAERIAREGVRAGCERVIVAGGDGTTSEVVTGLLAADLGRYAQLGLLPLGTGGDLRRTLAVPSDPEAAIERIARGKTRAIDAGRVVYHDRAGREARAYFLNVGSLGISGLVDELVNRTPKALGGRLSFLAGTLRALARYRSPAVRVRVDGVTVHEGGLLLATAANGRYFGGGMHVAPDARPDDGWLDVVVVPGLPRLRVLGRMPSLYRGTHVGDPAVAVHRGARVEAESVEPDAEVWIDVDGEPLGVLPARFEVLPGAITLLGCEG